MRLIVLSILRRRVEGLVMVVPRLLARPWPRLKAAEPIVCGEPGAPGEPSSAVPLAIAASSELAKDPCEPWPGTNPLEI